MTAAAAPDWTLLVASECWGAEPSADSPARPSSRRPEAWAAEFVPRLGPRRPARSRNLEAAAAGPGRGAAALDPRLPDRWREMSNPGTRRNGSSIKIRLTGTAGGRPPAPPRPRDFPQSALPEGPPPRRPLSQDLVTPRPVPLAAPSGPAPSPPRPRPLATRPRRPRLPGSAPLLPLGSAPGPPLAPLLAPPSPSSPHCPSLLPCWPTPRPPLLPPAPSLPGPLNLPPRFPPEPRPGLLTTLQVPPSPAS